jgi:hypothetical protein
MSLATEGREGATLPGLFSVVGPLRHLASSVSWVRGCLALLKWAAACLVLRVLEPAVALRSV